MLEDVIKWFNNYAQEIKEGRQLNDVVQCQVKNLEYLRSS